MIAAPVPNQALTIPEIRVLSRRGLSMIAAQTKSPKAAMKSIRLSKCRYVGKGHSEGACLFTIRVTTDHSSVCVGSIHVLSQGFRFGKVECVRVKA
jgi:hypothetical protein